ncbi:MAG TPA: PIG-L family deacetylase [Bryobacteraceae bacterium]|nr:PIG-L family deacetylase [Bryobacteraceae bacterium]
MSARRTKLATPPLRVLAVGAHPDDVELCCAGTLARCAERGDRIIIAVAARGDSASFDLSAGELVRVRSREARNAARVIGAEFIEMGLSDYGIDVRLENKKLFADVIRQARPDVIITHYHTEYGSDHNHTFVLVRDAALAATVPSVRTNHAALKRQPYIFMWEPLGGFAFIPEIYVDITTTMRAKQKMLACHRSQRLWMEKHGGVNFVEYIDVAARYRGFQAGVRYAEGFVPLKNWAQIAPRPLLP